jgi:hypothetical protein
LLCDLACKEVSLLQRGRRNELLSSRLGPERLGLGFGDNGRVPIPESHSKEESEQGEESAEEAEKLMRRPGKPVKDINATHPEATARAEIQEEGTETNTPFF